MSQSPTEILVLTSEAAVLVQHRRISFANAAARSLLGEDCVGQSLASLFGAEVAGMQASNFLADIPIHGKHYVVRFSRTEEGQILFLSPSDSPVQLLNEPFLCQLRSSLMNVGMAMELIREEAEKLGSRTILNSVCALNRSYFRLLRMTDNCSLLLNYAQDELPLALQTIDISALCRQAVDTVAALYPQMEFSTDWEPGILLVADPSMVLRQLMNLLSNCLCHARDCTRIRISLTNAVDSVILSVSDNGCGIDPAMLHMVFDRYRHGYSLAGMQNGSGFGLSAVRIVAQAHRGTLFLESRPGHGTAVRSSFSKHLSASVLRSKDPTSDDIWQQVLVGLADCLPEQYYTELYMD